MINKESVEKIIIPDVRPIVLEMLVEAPPIAICSLKWHDDGLSLVYDGGNHEHEMLILSSEDARGVAPKIDKKVVRKFLTDAIDHDKKNAL